MRIDITDRRLQGRLRTDEGMYRPTVANLNHLQNNEAALPNRD